MIDFSVTLDWDDPGAADWLVNTHIPAQFAKSLELIQFERQMRSAPFDALVRENLTGKLHFHLHATDWQLPGGTWVAGVTYLLGGPYPNDPMNDLCEISWKHEYGLNWDTMEHEIGHFLQYRMEPFLPSRFEDYQYMGHGGIGTDPLATAIFGMVRKGYPADQGYYPREIINAMHLPMSAEAGKIVMGCGGVRVAP